MKELSAGVVGGDGGPLGGLQSGPVHPDNDCDERTLRPASHRREGGKSLFTSPFKQEQAGGFPQE